MTYTRPTLKQTQDFPGVVASVSAVRTLPAVVRDTDARPERDTEAGMSRH